MLVSNRTDFEHFQMSIATLIILILLLAIIVGITIVVKMALSKLDPAPSSNSPSPAPASGSTTGSTPPSGGGGRMSNINWSILLSNILLSIAGLWLGAKIILFGGDISKEEIFVIGILAVMALGINQKKWFLSLLILVILLIKFLFPTEMETIVIDKDGIYELPNIPLKVCFTMTGDPKINFYLDNRVNIGGNIFVQREDGCKNLPDSLNGSVSISLLSGQPYSQKVKDKIGMQDINNNYEYYMKVGFGGYPTIQAR